jgi:chromosome segregation ATPase
MLQRFPEFISALQQAHTSLKLERDALELKTTDISTKETEWETQKSLLEEKFADTREQLSTSEKERDNYSQENLRLLSLVKSHETSIEEHQEKLVQAASALATITRQLQSAQNELRVANRRADDAEKTQQSLQGEGTNLMRALDEMRPKIVELTGAKLELSEKVASLEHTIRSRDSVIVQLENDLEEARDLNGETEATWKERLAEQERRHKEVQTGASDIQKAYTERQEELDTALASLRNLESQRANSHQEAARRLEEIERLKNQMQSQGEELDALRHEIEARRQAHVMVPLYLENSF